MPAASQLEGCPLQYLRFASPSVANRDARIDLARCAACWLVVMLHTAAGGFGSFGPRWWPSNILDSLSRPSVPIFLMISGALLLPRAEPLAVFAHKRLSRLLPPLAFWSVIYLIWPVWGDVVHLSELAFRPAAVHLWYLYALIGLYALVPVLRIFHQHASRSVQIYFLALWFSGASILPTCRDLLGLPWSIASTYGVEEFSGLFGYLLLGALVHDAGSRHGGRWGGWVTLYLAASVATMFLTYIRSRTLGRPDEFWYGYLSPVVVIASFAAFQFLMRLQVRGELASRTIVWIGGCTLGIYCAHPEVAYQLSRAGWIGNMSIPITTLIVFLTSLLIVSTLRSVPAFRWVM